MHLRIRDVVPQSELSGIIENIVRETETDRPGKEKAALHYLGILGCAGWSVRRQCPAMRPSAPMPRAGWRGLMPTFWSMNFRSGMGVSDLARELGVTSTHLTRVCNKTCGRSASDLLHDRLILRGAKASDGNTHTGRQVAQFAGI